MTAPSPELDPESLVARIISELESSPGAQSLLLRALLTNEFLGMPIRLERIEADVAKLKGDVAVLKDDVKVLKDDVGVLKSDVKALKGDVGVLKDDVKVLEDDVGVLKGGSLELKLQRRIKPLVSQKLNLRKARLMQDPLENTHPELLEPVETAVNKGMIVEAQETRVMAADIVLHAQRKDSLSQVWVAVEVSNHIGQRDIDRARQSADALRAVFQLDAIAVVAGYRIHHQGQERADNADVHTFLIEEEG